MTTIMNKQFNKQMCYHFDNMSDFVRSFDRKHYCKNNAEYCDKSAVGTPGLMEELAK